MKKKIVLNSFLVLTILPIALELLVLGGILSESPSNKLIEFCFGKGASTQDFVEFLDVGQGDSTLIKSGNSVALIDFGVEDDGIKIQKYLFRLGIKKIDVAVITHHHSDHMGGFLRVAEKIKIEKLIINNSTAEDGDTELYSEVLGLAQSLKIELILPKCGQNFKIGNADLSILSCNRNANEENNRSVVSILNISGKKFLFTGDCDSDTECQLALNHNVKCDVLKMGHHGSKSSSAYYFLELAQPEIAIASCGYDNIYNHPSGDALLRFKELGIEIYRTDLDKNIRFTFQNYQNSYDISIERRSA
ncbi:MAG: MBL fold metallo-hydrolase [Ruminococcaceae bacterium]|nr:MBL fold metallo-hydrolase [Oscillospiraceae bacterium]